LPVAQTQWSTRPPKGFATLRNHTFLARQLPASPLVADCGAHQAEWATSFVDCYGGRALAVEANPALAGTIPLTASLTPLWAAITAHGAAVEFHVNDNPEASTVVSNGAVGATKSVMVPGCGLTDLLSLLESDRLDILKLDIEGAETAVLAEAPSELLQKFDQISVEFHDFCDMVESTEVDEAIALMNWLGFWYVRCSTWKRMDCLFVNVRQVPVSRARRAWVGMYFWLRRQEARVRFRLRAPIALPSPATTQVAGPDPK
jgi:FkbM family methyltransferase